MTSREPVYGGAMRDFSFPGVRSARRAWLALVAAVFLILGIPAAGHAHDVLLESTPADGETVTEPLDAVTLTFNNTIQEVGSQLIVTNESGEVVAEVSGQPQGTLAGFEFDAPLPNGQYTVAWRVVSSDAHPIDGDFGFTMADPQAADATDPEPAEEPATSEETPATEDPEAGDPTEQPSSVEAPDDTASSDTSDEGWPITGIMVGAALGGLVGVGIVVLIRRRNQR